MAWKRALAAMVVAMLQFTPARASAAKHVSLSWEAAEACPDESALVAAVTGLLGQPLSETREQDLTVRISVQAGGDGFSAKLVLTTPQRSEERFLEHPDCNKLMEASALLVALAIDPERVRTRPASEAPAASVDASLDSGSGDPSHRAAREPSTPPTRPSPPTPPVPNRPIESRDRVTLGVAAFVGAGVLPGLGEGFATQLGLRSRRLHFRVEGRHWLPRTSEIQGGPLGIELSLASAGAVGCGAPHREAWSIWACLGFQVGDLAGSGQGLNEGRTRHALYGALEGSVMAGYSRVEPNPIVGLGLAWALARPSFGATLAGVDTETFRPSQLGILAFLGLSLGL